MVRVIKYTNGERGYDIYGNTDGVSPKCLHEISNFCQKVYDNGDTSSNAAYRFCKVSDGYLFSVIFRNISDNEQIRIHHKVVNFLMDRTDADNFFLFKFNSISKYYHDLSMRIIKGDKVSDNEIQIHNKSDNLTKGGNYHIPQNVTSTLFMGAICGNIDEFKETQTILVCSNPISKIDWLISHLPIQLRKTISFHTDVCGATELFDVSLALCSQKNFDYITGQHFAGADTRTKYIYSEYEPHLNANTKTEEAKLFSNSEETHLINITSLLHSNENWNLYKILLANYFYPSVDNMSKLVELYIVDLNYGEQETLELFTGKTASKPMIDALRSIDWNKKDYPLFFEWANPPKTKKAKNQKNKSHQAKPKKRGQNNRSKELSVDNVFNENNNSSDTFYGDHNKNHGNGLLNQRSNKSIITQTLSFIVCVLITAALSVLSLTVLMFVFKLGFVNKLSTSGQTLYIALTPNALLDVIKTVLTIFISAIFGYVLRLIWERHFK